MASGKMIADIPLGDQIKKIGVGRAVNWIAWLFLVPGALVPRFLGFKEWLSGYIKQQITISGLPPTVDSLGYVDWIIIVLLGALVTLAAILVDRVIALRGRKAEGEREANAHLQRLRRTFYNHIKKQERPHKLLSLNWTYTCSLDERDFARMETIIEADDLLVKVHRIGRTPYAGLSSKPTYEELRFKPFTDDGKAIEAELVEESPDHFLVALFLDPPVGGTKIEDRRRTIGCTYTWPGLWDRLRRENFDTGDVTAGADVDEMTIKLKFPPEDAFGKVRLTRRYPPSGTVNSGTDESGYQEISWVVGAARKREVLEFEVERTAKK